MNKLHISSIIACGLLLLNSPQAAAHETRENRHLTMHYDSHDRIAYSRSGYRDDRHGHRREHHDLRHKRANKMPRWLQRDRAFRHWFEQTRLRRNRYISWNQLFDVYSWERPYYRYSKH